MSTLKRARDETEVSGAGAGAGAGSDKVDDTITLYSYWRSSCSYRVRIGLNLKGLKYGYTPVHLLKDGGQQFVDTYVKKNPMKEIPTLEIDGHALCQSNAILHYLEETRPEVPLLPSNAIQRAKVRQIAESIGTDIQPVQNLRVLKKVMSREETKEEKDKRKIEWGHHWIESGFDGVERILAETAGTYCVGDTVTLADVYLVPQVYNANRFGVDMSKFPTIARVHETLQKLDAFKDAIPENQPDATP